MYSNQKLLHPRYEKVIILSLIHNFPTTEVIKRKSLHHYSYQTEPIIINLFPDMHGNVDYMVGDTRVICNPKGYPIWLWRFDDHEVGRCRSRSPASAPHP